MSWRPPRVGDLLYGLSAGAALLVPMLWIGEASAAPPTPPGEAATEAVEGRVVAFELGDFVVDVASDRGATNGVLLELWRPLSIKHPVTGQLVSDRFLIGRLRLTQVRGALSLARADGKLSQPPQPGDVVVFHRRSSAGGASPNPAGDSAAKASSSNSQNSDQPSSAAPEGASGPTVNVAPGEANEVSALFDGLRGASVSARVQAYEGYVTQHPHGQYALVLYEEAAQLRRLIALERDTAAGREPLLRSFQPPTEARSHTPLGIALEVSNEPLSGAILHSRNAGEVAYHSLPMKPAGGGYYAATVAADRMRAPVLEYFVEGVGTDGKARFLLGSAEAPQSVEVSDVPVAKVAARPPATVSLSTDYADWNNFKGNDVVWQTEGSVGMRFEDVGLRAARTGFGVYRGTGGSLAELDQQKVSGRSVGLTYGYLEGEFGISHFTSIIGRLVIGLEDDGVNGGAQALLRLGNDRETNLTIGGEALGGIGLRGITELQLASFPRVPILFRTEVTNQPAGVAVPKSALGNVATEVGEVGARAIAQVGYRFLPELVVALRGSYQGRTINHAGPGFGGAVTYQW
jgi:hypothetical protein